MFIALSSLSASLATKCKFINNEPCITRTTLIDLNPDQKCKRDKCQRECKKPITNYVCKKNWNAWNPNAYLLESAKYWEMNIQNKQVHEISLKWFSNCLWDCVNQLIIILSILFTSSHIVINNSYYLLLLHKILGKTKT